MALSLTTLKCMAESLINWKTASKALTTKSTRSAMRFWPSTMTIKIVPKMVKLLLIMDTPLLVSIFELDN